MRQPQVFVSHSSQDKAFTASLVSALQAAGCDAWWDEHDLGLGKFLDTIQREIHDRPIFVVVLSKAALASNYVLEECRMAYTLHLDEPNREIVPVTVSSLQPSDLRPNWLFLEPFKRIEATGFQPYPPQEAITKVVEYLVPPTIGDCHVPLGWTAKQLTEEGLRLYNRHEHECSVRYCRRATELDPTYASAWYNLAYSLKELGRFDEALAACDRALALGPNQAFYWNLRGYILDALGRFQDQLAAAERAIELKPSSARNWANKADALISLGRPAEALEAAERGLAITPGSEFVRSAKAEALHGLKRYNEALAICDELIAERHRRHAGDYCRQRAWILRDMGRHQDALHDFQRAALLDPDDDDAWKGLAQTYRTLGMRREAQEADQRAQRLGRA